VEEFEPQDTTVALSNITDDQVAYLVRQKSITPELEQTLRKVVQQKNVVAGIDVQILQRQRESNEINVDQQRVRENMKALKGTAEEKQLTQRYATQLNQQEDRLAALRKEIADLQAQRQDAQTKLNQMIEDISMDVML
jgi:predicted  nucleic acid-binding Zn-ribbon protein